MIKTNIGEFNSLEEISDANIDNIKEIYINNKGITFLSKIIKDFWNLEILDLSNTYFGYKEWTKYDIGLQNWIGTNNQENNYNPIYDVDLVPNFFIEEYNDIFTEGNILSFNLNQLSSLPNEIANLQKLKVLNINNAYKFKSDFTKQDICIFDKNNINNYYIYNDKLIVINFLNIIPEMKNIRLINILNQDYIKGLDFFYPDTVQVLQINNFSSFDLYISSNIKVLNLFTTDNKNLENHINFIKEIQCYNNIEIYLNTIQIL